MAKTNEKELIIKIENNKELDFITTIKKRINFLSLHILLKQNAVHVILRGPRERINYAIQVLKKIQKEMNIL